MNVINSILLDVINMIREAIPADWPVAVRVGALPADNGISVAIGAGAPRLTFMDKGESFELDLVLNGKSADQQTLLNTLNEMHRLVSKTKTYRHTTDYQITNMSTISTPHYIDRDERGQFLYGSSLRVNFYYKR